MRLAYVGTLFFLVAICSILFFYRLADRDLWSSHEARAAQDAQSILSEKQWGLPHLFDGKIELQKPPLFYWIVAGVSWLRGSAVDSWSVRLPAALAGLLGVVLIYMLGVLRNRPHAGLAAACILASAVHFTWLARVGRIDMPLTLCCAFACVGFYLAHCSWRELGGRGAWRWMVVGYLAAAFALMLKGPIGLLLPAAVCVAYLGTEGDLPVPWQLRRWLSLFHKYGLWWGIPLIGALAIPWFVWADSETNGKLLQVFFWKHNVERGLGSGDLAVHPWWFYLPRFTVDFLPWSPILPFLILLAIRRRWWRVDSEARFGLVWLVAMTMLLSFSRFKRSDYLLPAFPGAALFLGSTLERWYSTQHSRKALTAAFVGMLLAAVAGWWAYVAYVLPGQERQWEFRRFAQEIRARAPAPQLIIFFRAEAHALAFHVGRPIDTVLEWENLDVWASRPETWYIVMPPDCADEWPQYLTHGQLELVMRNIDLAGGKHSRPLVLMRTRPGAGPLPRERSAHAREFRPASDRTSPTVAGLVGMPAEARIAGESSRGLDLIRKQPGP